MLKYVQKKDDLDAKISVMFDKMLKKPPPQEVTNFNYNDVSGMKHVLTDVEFVLTPEFSPVLHWPFATKTKAGHTSSQSNWWGWCIRSRSFRFRTRRYPHFGTNLVPIVFGAAASDISNCLTLYRVHNPSLSIPSILKKAGKFTHIRPRQNHFSPTTENTCSQQFVEGAAALSKNTIQTPIHSNVPGRNAVESTEERHLVGERRSQSDEYSSLQKYRDINCAEALAFNLRGETSHPSNAPALKRH